MTQPCPSFQAAAASLRLEAEGVGEVAAAVEEAEARGAQKARDEAAKVQGGEVLRVCRAIPNPQPHLSVLVELHK